MSIFEYVHCVQILKFRALQDEGSWTGHGVVFLRVTAQVNNMIKGLNRITSNESNDEEEKYEDLKDHYYDCVDQNEKQKLVEDTIPNSTSSFPHFIPNKSREIMKTHYYMFRFYECRITKQFPHQFNFLILPGQLEFYQNKIVNQS